MLSRYCMKGKCPGRVPEVKECPSGWRNVWTRGRLYCQRGKKKLTWNAAWKKREAKLGIELGAAEDVHRDRMEEDFKIAQNYIRIAKEAAKKRDCWQVWDSLMVVRARVSDYYAHMESVPYTAAEWNRHAKLGTELHRLQESLGWQCTRKLK